MGISQIPPSAGVKPFVQTFTSTGTFTAPSTCNMVEITLVGGGGGGGGAASASNNSIRSGGGGGGGLVVKKRLSVTPGTSYTVTIGAGGSGGTNLAAGSVGSDSSFGALATALGGGSGASRGASSFLGVPRGTGGGTWGNQNGVSGAGGGAGGSAMLYGRNNDANYQPFLFNLGSTYISDNNNRGRGGGAGGQSFQASSTLTTIGIAGIGIDGFGNGAPGTYGTTDGTLSFYISSGYANQAPNVVDRASVNGTAATANTGDGGNGGVSANIDDTPLGNATGGAGGSGICIVTYWA
jgi:hypothetical protein